MRNAEQQDPLVQVGILFAGSSCRVAVVRDMIPGRGIPSRHDPRGRDTSRRPLCWNSVMPQPEVWLRGPIPGIPALLQPVAHGLLQCREELTARVTGLTPDQMWARPFGAASIGFHARHAAGSVDRLFTYARGAALSP